MPRLPRKYLKTSYLHIIVQGINKEYIFEDDNLKQKYKSFFKKNLLDSTITILAYCIMNNHAHFLLHSPSSYELSKLMHKTNTSFAKLYNKTKKRVGYVFNDRYYIQMILNENHLFNCISYIHNNPVKANIVHKMEDYAFSSYIEYTNKKDLITSKSIQLAFNNLDDYEKVFNQIHARRNIDDIIDIKEEIKDSDKIIQEYIDKKSITLEEIINNENEFCNLLLDLRHLGGLSLREMSKIFNINKDKINKIINKHL